jgi:hypothetical protein
VVAALDDDEAVGDEGRIGVGRVGRRVAAGAVVVGIGRRLIDEDAAGEVDRQGDLAAQVASVMASITSGLVE